MEVAGKEWRNGRTREEVVKRKGEGKESVKRDVVKKWKDAEN